MYLTAETQYVQTCLGGSEQIFLDGCRFFPIAGKMFSYMSSFHFIILSLLSFKSTSMQAERYHGHVLGKDFQVFKASAKY